MKQYDNDTTNNKQKIEGLRNYNIKTIKIHGQ